MTFETLGAIETASNSLDDDNTSTEATPGSSPTITSTPTQTTTATNTEATTTADDGDGDETTSTDGAAMTTDTPTTTTNQATTTSLDDESLSDLDDLLSIYDAITSTAAAMQATPTGDVYIAAVKEKKGWYWYTWMVEHGTYPDWCVDGNDSQGQSREYAGDYDGIDDVTLPHSLSDADQAEYVYPDDDDTATQLRDCVFTPGINTFRCDGLENPHQV
ncbi:hypothetical protein N7532_005335 [Penicillium argentinense]|uniref:Uncharacterized protein n=1 Tax=Penicillium argentinense TaxID=1131581 RepID=A0A9W9FDV5_9EURO|nr:uncharacterized protein N7532_005335 [Penicillium argentinense]KAJ5098334.1 hypothetical protein N7532_005335 [Penicillium argentinense]